MNCDHDRGHRIVTNYLQVPGYDEVYAVGDCASITDPHTGKPYPPTAQHAIREAKVAARNIIISVKKGKASNDNKPRSVFGSILIKTTMHVTVGAHILTSSQKRRINNNEGQQPDENRNCPKQQQVSKHACS